nr:PREDICTED: cytochrome c oxidase subunit 8A, mitochondrial-like [Stegastes partitus]
MERLPVDDKSTNKSVNLLVISVKSQVINKSHMTGVQQRATYIHDKPPKDKIGVMESAFVLTVMTLTVLGPSGWILSHVDEYKTRRP